jgi:hypothetical protein
VFGYGSAPFNVLNAEFRRRVIEEAARHDLDLIFTFVWNMGDPDDLVYVEQQVAPVVDAGGEVVVVELVAGLATRLARNHGEDRLAAKPTKRDLDWSDANLRRLESHQLNSDPTGANPTPADQFLSAHRYLRLDTEDLSAARTADIVLAWLAGHRAVAP